MDMTFILLKKRKTRSLQALNKLYETVGTNPFNIDWLSAFIGKPITYTRAWFYSNKNRHDIFVRVQSSIYSFDKEKADKFFKEAGI